MSAAPARTRWSAAAGVLLLLGLAACDAGTPAGDNAVPALPTSAAGDTPSPQLVIPTPSPVRPPQTPPSSQGAPD
ncbi:MAG: hypothetical protein ACYDGR_01170 [Candidatus Dormibacteria bacterium]